MTNFAKFKIDPVEYILNTDNIITNSDDNNYSELHKKLNQTKSLLDNIPEKEYARISQKLDIFKSMRQVLSFKYKMQIVTNATIKIYELITQMGLINSNKLTAFCNAELPGNFIIGINHYIKTMFKTSSFNWVASSFISNSGTLGDSYGIYEFNKNNWLMDSTMNGDITDPNNIIEISKRVLSRFPKGVDLYTSDAGFDVSSDYNKQEEQTITLNYGQILAGLLTLSIGGHLVTKQFTYFTEFNKSLIILLSNLFDEFYITKPSSSRPLNSEIYLVGKGFKGISSDLKEYLLSKVTLINIDIPLILYNENVNLFESMSYIYERQISYILYVNDIYINKKMIYINYKDLHQEWLHKNPMYVINKLNYINKK